MTIRREVETLSKNGTYKCADTFPEFLCRNGSCIKREVPMNIYGKSHIDDKIIKFKVSEFTAIGDARDIEFKGKPYTVTVESIEKEAPPKSAYTIHEWTPDSGYGYYNEIPFDLDSEEKEALEKAFQESGIDVKLRYISNDTPAISAVLFVAACVLFVIGFILGLYFGSEYGRYGDFNIGVMLAYGLRFLYKARYL